MTASLLLSWREGVSTEAEGESAFRVESGGTRLVLRQLGPAMVTALRRLSPPGENEDALAELVLEAGGSTALAGWYYWLQSLSRRGLLCRAVQAGEQRLATLAPISAAFVFAPLTVNVDSRCRLCRFAYLHREGDRLLLESPRAHARILLDDDRVAGLVGVLAKPTTARELGERLPGLPGDAVSLLVGLLASAGMLQEMPEGADSEDANLRSWEFHDLLFHARSRKGRSDAPFGATYRLAGQMAPPPAIKPDEGREYVELYRPDLQSLAQTDAPLSEVIERRRSLRQYGKQPISDRQVGEFLYRVARVKDCRDLDLPTPQGPLRMAFASRPYPSGGGLYELEFYVAVNACAGLARGLYHYDGQHHRLGRVCGHTEEVGHLLEDAAASAGIAAEQVQVLVILSARFSRLAWKYVSIAYALILKHVGVVYQTMYLTATAMKLAPCALGGGDSDLFARAAGTDYYTETSVGEFLLGSAMSNG